MYRVLYRKWRPKVFADVIGQPQVTVTLSSQIKENRLSHAYLFTGSRGTGKTTCAKIFAKAVNCLAPVNGDPCNECEICRGIDAGSVLDIFEIDAASNRSIDDIRALKEEVNFTPSQAKFRVYIIDEVHMLTIEAFNALLKTLEEPPSHVKFVLATTEVHKLPSTILSRCQRFDFRRIEPQDIAERLEYITGEEGAVIEHEAALLIARISDGGMRDALSLLDRCISVSERITVDTVSACAGLMGREHIYSLVRAIGAGDTARCLELLDELHKGSCDTERLVSELIDRFRSFLIVKTVASPENLIVSTAQELEEIREISRLFTKEAVLYALDVLTSASEAMRKTQNRRIEAEMALIRLSRPESDDSSAALLVRIAQLEKEIAELKRNGVRAAPVNTGLEGYSAPRTPARDVQPPVRNEAVTAVGAEPKKDEAPPFDEDVPPFDEAPPFDEDVPPFDEAPPFEEDAPPFDDETPPFDESSAKSAPAKSSSLGEFKGFGSEGASMGFADMFSAASAAEGDSDFDFDAFMKKHQGAPKKPTPDPRYPAFAPEEPDLNKYSATFEESLPEEGGEGRIDNRTWGKIVLETESLFTPLIGQLTGSRARIDGNYIIITLGEKNLKVFVNEKMMGNYVSRAAFTVLGKDYKIKID